MTAYPQVGVVDAPRGSSHRDVGPGAPSSLLHRRGRRHQVHHPQALPEPEAHRIRRPGYRLVSAQPHHNLIALDRGYFNINTGPLEARTVFSST